MCHLAPAGLCALTNVERAYSELRAARADLEIA